MKKNLILFIYLMLCSTGLWAALLKGRVVDAKGEALPFASVYIKGTTKGTTTNLEGNYTLDIAVGKHIIVCQYVGFQKVEFEIEINEGEQKKNITLQQNEHSIKEIKVTSGENLALAIVKKAIKKRASYEKQIDKYKANVYIKGNFRLNDVPNLSGLQKMMGGKKNDTKSNETKEEMDQMKGIIYLSESYNEIYYKRPDKLKINVISSRVSGRSSDYGLSYPIFINLYNNNVMISKQFTPRGIISPIADAATLSYSYELLNAYMDDGKLINRIKVTPRRKFEPLFEGIIEIVDKDWNINSADLVCTKNSGLSTADSLRFKQIYVPKNNLLVVKDQSMHITLDVMGFGVTGDFVNVYSDYEFDFNTREVFTKYLQEYADDALNSNYVHWDTTRLVPLTVAEAEDFRKKDSIERSMKDKPDTIKTTNTIKQIITRGLKFENKKYVFTTEPIIGLYSTNFNTTEGVNYNYGLSLQKKIAEHKQWTSKIGARYGWSNQQFNVWMRSAYQWGKTNHSKMSIAVGRRIFQFNNNAPVNETMNSLYTLFLGENYFKFYQAKFVQATYQYIHINGLTLDAQLMYQQRQMLRNTNTFTFAKTQTFTENYPVEKINAIEPNHQALVADIRISYQPGRKYIKYPDRVISLPSRFPVFGLQYQHAGFIGNLLSDVQYNKWRAVIADDLNLHIWGDFKYKLSIGGFIQHNKLYVADYTHFNGGQMILASPYMNSFQISPYYLNSNTEPLYATMNVEHHFNGFLTNKIPLFNKLRWNLVAASNLYYVNQHNNYIELSVGLENIGFQLMRFIRVDGIVGYSNFKLPVYGIRIGFQKGIIGFGKKNDD